MTQTTDTVKDAIRSVIQESMLTWIAHHDYPEFKVDRFIGELTEDLFQIVQNPATAVKTNS